MEESGHGHKDRRKRAGKRSVPGILEDSLWVSRNGAEPSLNIRKIGQADDTYAGREQRISKVCLGEIIAL